jgi:hypothetical protein
MSFRARDTVSSSILRVVPAVIVAALIAACTSDDGAAHPTDASTTVDGQATDGGADVAPATCPTPGSATSGPADTHCAAADGGAARAQATSAASCHPDAGGDDGGANDEGCPYGDTMFGQEADDDDCKYHVAWTASPICEGAGGVAFKVVATNKTDNTPLTGAGTSAEVFTSSPADAGCDNVSTHPGPNSGVTLTEGPPGTYTGRVAFDAPGAWTVRFHFHAECEDLLPDSPHGHAAFHVTVP